MTITDQFALRYTGVYSLVASVTLAASASFVDSLHPAQDHQTEVLDLAFPLEGSWKPVGVRIWQSGDEVLVQVVANPDNATRDAIRASLERMLSLDVDGAGFAAVVSRNAVLAELAAKQPGVRPVLLPSPYEAAARAIIGHQLPVRQAAAISSRISSEQGVCLPIGDYTLAAFPAPARLVNLPAVPGLAARKVTQLRQLGEATLDGKLDSTYLRTLGIGAALSSLQQLSGIGPFSAELIWMRGVGDADAFPQTETRLHRAMAAAYHLGNQPALDALEQVARDWRPYRNWAGLLLRNSISR